MEKIKVKLNTTEKADGYYATYYCAYDLIAIQPSDTSYQFECRTATYLNISRGTAYGARYHTFADNKIPAYTPIIIYAKETVSKYAEFEVQPKNTFKSPVESIMFGTLQKYTRTDPAIGHIRFYSLCTYDGDIGLYINNNTTMSANKAFIPTVIIAGDDKASTYDSLPVLNKYYYKATGSRVDFQKLITRLQGKSVEERKKVYKKLARRITRRKSCDNFCMHPHHEGKRTEGGHSFLDRLLYTVVVFVSVK